MLSNLLPRLRPNRLLLFILLPATLALLTACGSGNPQDTFHTAGPVAEDQANLFMFIFWIAVVVFFLVEIGLVFIAFRYRRGRNSAMPQQIHGNTKLEITWTIIPTLILVAIAIPTVRGIWDLADPPSDEPVMNVEAIGHQWWFEFRYPGDEIITANELHVPVGTNVLVTLESQDVIHSFWVPRLFGKVDMVPVHENQVWFRADEPGDFYGQCAEFCGLAHARMRFRVIAQSQEDYDAWVAGMHTAPTPLDPGSTAASGQNLFAANCSTCHTTNGYQPGAYDQEIQNQNNRWTAFLQNPDSSAIVSAPNLTNLGLRTTFAAGTEPLTRDNLIKWITDPSQIKEGTRMQEHAFVYQTQDHKANLTSEEISDIADYLLSLVPGEVQEQPGGPTEQDPAVLGQQLFNSNGCSGCHSTGTNTVVGPGLAGVYERAGQRKPDLNADQYITESVRHPQAFIVPGFPNPSPMPTFSNLSDDEVNALIAYLKTLN